MAKKALLSIYSISIFISLGLAQGMTPAQLAQQQLDGYNQHNLDLFLAPYADSVIIYQFPNQVIYQGKEQMRETYGKMFESNKDLFCTLMNRMIMGNTVMDHEYVVFDKNEPAIEVIAMYKIRQQKIVEVYFIRNNEE